MSIPKWGGRKAQAWTAAVLATRGRVCLLQLEGCTRLATQGDHIVPRSVDLTLQYDVTNGRPACAPCNQQRSNRPDEPVIVDVLDLLRPRTLLGGLLPILPPGNRKKAGRAPITPEGPRP